MSEPQPYPRVFVTGATGFLGAHLVAALIAGGREVIALVRDPASSKAARVSALGATLVRGDVLNMREIYGLTKREIEDEIHEMNQGEPLSASIMPYFFIALRMT